MGKPTIEQLVEAAHEARQILRRRSAHRRYADLVVLSQEHFDKLESESHYDKYDTTVPITFMGVPIVIKPRDQQAKFIAQKCFEGKHVMYVDENGQPEIKSSYE